MLESGHELFGFFGFLIKSAILDFLGQKLNSVSSFCFSLFILRDVLSKKTFRLVFEVLNRGDKSQLSVFEFEARSNGPESFFGELFGLDSLDEIRNI